MKQNITIKQLQELTKKERQKLNKWRKTLIKCGSDIDECHWDPKIHLVLWEEQEKSLPLLSIGQMIEFLGEYKQLFVGCNNERNLELTFLNTKIGKAPNDICYELWEAVKESLEKNDN